MFIRKNKYNAQYLNPSSTVPYAKNIFLNRNTIFNRFILIL